MNAADRLGGVIDFTDQDEVNQVKGKVYFHSHNVVDEPIEEGEDSWCDFGDEAEKGKCTNDFLSEARVNRISEKG